MKTLKLIVLATVLAVSPACSNKKDAENKAPPVADNTGSAMGSAGSAGSATDMAGSAGSADMAGSAAAGSAAVTPDPNADYIDVYAEHAEKKPDDPVAVHFDRFKVVKADFDPKKVEGGTATIELDLTSLKSGSDKRDKHLASPDYLDTSKFTTLTIDIGNVKKKADNTYTADAKVKLRDTEKKYPVTFEVVETGEDWIRVKGEHKFARLDFKVGGKPSKDESVAQELTVKLQLTLKKT
ncbi:MAG: YceI family protein [Deltaproteobacteria bacterium]|nr:YceI family protein [Deltaproteobacteria bacterium]MDQ3298520.1 YceI family protein [Myxococcota bacterium]